MSLASECCLENVLFGVAKEEQMDNTYTDQGMETHLLR